MSIKFIPTPTYKRELAQLEKVYGSALKEITQMLVSVDPSDLLKRDLYESIIRQITYIMNDLNSHSKEWVQKTLTEAFGESQAIALVSMGIAKDLVEAKGKQQFSLMSRQRIEAMISDTFGDILQATTHMDNKLKKLVREVQGEVLRQNTALQRGTVTSAKDLKNALADKGFSRSLVEENWTGIVDAGGRRWDLTTYTQMVARTKLQQVQIEGARMTALENENDLAMVSSHGAKDGCGYFEGMIISLEGKTKGYSTLDDIRGSGLIFHPNCQHSVHPIGDVNALPQKLKDKAQKAQDSADYAMSHVKEVKAQSNQMDYQQRKQKVQQIKEQRKKALEKAREAKKNSRSQ